MSACQKIGLHIVHPVLSYLYDLVQYCSNSIANALELLRYFTKSLIDAWQQLPICICNLPLSSWWTFVISFYETNIIQIVCKDRFFYVYSWLVNTYQSRALMTMYFKIRGQRNRSRMVSWPVSSGGLLLREIFLFGPGEALSTLFFLASFSLRGTASLSWNVLHFSTELRKIFLQLQLGRMVWTGPW